MTSQPQTAKPSRLARIPVSWWISALLVLGVIAVYWPVFHYGFVNYDDPKYVFQNPHVRTGLNGSGIVWAFTTFHASNWHPLTWLSLMLDTQCFGFHPQAYHVVNVLFHAANTVLLFLVLKRMTGLRQNGPQQPLESSDSRRESAPSLAPVPGESGADPSRIAGLPGEKGFFDERPKAAAPPAGAMWRSAFVTALFAFHPLHVESVAWISERKDVLSTFFFMLTLLAYTQYVASGKWQATRTTGLLSRVTCHVSPFYFLALFFFALGLMSKPMLVTLPFVLLLLDFWPLKRMAGDKWQVTGLRIANFRFFLSLVTRHLSLFLEKLPFFALSAVSCVVTILAQKHGEAMALNSYIPFTGRLQTAIVSYLLYLGKMFWPVPLAAFYPYPMIDPATTAVAAYVLILISVAAFLSPRRRPYLTMGWLWYLGTLVPVIGLVQAGMQGMADRYTYVPLIGVFIAITWGMADMLSGWRYRRAALAVASMAVLGICLALTAVQVRYWRDSETLAHHGLAVTTHNAMMQVLLGSALLEQKKFEEAGRHFTKAAKIWPNAYPVQCDLALALAGQGKTNEAIATFRIAEKIKPDEVTPHYMLASLLSRQGNVSEAIAEYEATLQLNPNHRAALNDFAWLLATTPDARFRNGAKAVELAEKACRLTDYKLPLFVGTLAAAYAEAGRFDDAVKTAEKAIALATADGIKALVAKNRKLLELYQAHKAYHQPSAH